MALVFKISQPSPFRPSSKIKMYRKLSQQQWRNHSDRGKPMYWGKKKTRPVATLSTAKFTRTDLGSNQDLRSEKLANNRSSPDDLIYRYRWTARTAQTTLIASRERTVAHLLGPYNTGALFDPINIVFTSCRLPFNITSGH